MRCLVLTAIIVLLNACGGKSPAKIGPQSSPSNVPPALPAADPWVAAEVTQLAEQMLLVQTPFHKVWNELTINPASAGKSSVDFFFEAPTEGALRIQELRIEGVGCAQENATRSELQLVSSAERKSIQSDQEIALGPRAYRVRLGLDNTGACQSFKVRFRAPWEGPRVVDAVDNYNVPAPSPLRTPLKPDDLANPLLKSIENTDEGTWGACLRQAIENQAPAEGKDIMIFQGQPLRDDEDASVATYAYFTRQPGSPRAARRFHLRIRTSDGQAWRFIYDGFKATAYAAGLSLQASASESDTGDLTFAVNLAGCKELIPRQDLSGR